VASSGNVEELHCW